MRVGIRFRELVPLDAVPPEFSVARVEMTFRQILNGEAPIAIGGPAPNMKVRCRASPRSRLCPISVQNR
jgi:hypothetical protein